MLTTIALSAVTGVLGLAAGAAVSSAGLGLRRRVSDLETLQAVIPELISRQEVSDAFGQLALIEEKRRQEFAAQMRRQRVQSAPFSVPSPAANPIFQQAAMGGMPGGGPEATAATDFNALLNQQLAALNERLQQVTAQRAGS